MEVGEISKSSRHSAIVGHFGEHLVCNWLSRSGFDACVVDYTGMDIIAYNRGSKERLGITVKSLTREPGTETHSVNIFRETKDDREKLKAACKAFHCEPWIAIYVERGHEANLFVMSLENYDRKYRSRERRAVDTLKMTKKHRTRYTEDTKVRHIRITFEKSNWFPLPGNRSRHAA